MYHLVLVGLTLLDLWAFIKVYLVWLLPEWAIHFMLLPGLAYGLSYVPNSYLTVFAACGIVYILDGLRKAEIPVQSTRAVRRSNIPPPP